jgi:hypothetical protein
LVAFGSAAYEGVVAALGDELFSLLGAVVDAAGLASLVEESDDEEPSPEQELDPSEPDDESEPSDVAPAASPPPALAVLEPRLSVL